LSRVAELSAETLTMNLAPSQALRYYLRRPPSQRLPVTLLSAETNKSKGCRHYLRTSQFFLFFNFSVRVLAVTFVFMTAWAFEARHSPPLQNENNKTKLYNNTPTPSWHKHAVGCRYFTKTSI